MQMYPNQFPEHRRNEPTRQAEFREYNKLQNSDLKGLGIYGGRPSADCPEIDFAVLLQGRARLAHEVKGDCIPWNAASGCSTVRAVPGRSTAR